ncbi:uncharacterized protein TNCV_4069601 [Trichonephila clavipes]|nr:uncharacterized protein TNCV_4069601 [Trichonephila clavipes]
MPSWNMKRINPKCVRAFCAVSSSNELGQFYFAEKTVTGIINLDMLQIFSMPIIKEKILGVNIFQQDHEPYHYHNDVTSCLNAEITVWISRGVVVQGPIDTRSFTTGFQGMGFCKESSTHSTISCIHSVTKIKSVRYN